MATPAAYSNSAAELTDMEDEKARSDYGKGRDADIPSERQTQTDLTKDADLEKGTDRRRADSNKSDEQTLNEDEAPSNAQVEEADPDIVNWDGPNDPENPQNWADREKWKIISVLALVTLVTYVRNNTLPSSEGAMKADSHFIDLSDPRSSRLVSRK